MCPQRNSQLLAGLLVCLTMVSQQVHLLPIRNSTHTSANSRSQVLVRTTSGILHGTQQALNVGSTSIYKFLAVPYAQAPIGQLRFKKPKELPAERAQMQVDASEHGSTCPQYRHLARFISPLLNLDTEHQTSEDCLHLNVYVPSWIGNLVEGNKLEPSRQVPVIVWIPGEGFDFADARQFDGSYLAQQTQSIVITVQYRVGVLGFLDAPQFGINGNMGIHDQIMALRWIQNNIHSFGGDSERVTLMGRFSGSMTISTLLTAPKESLIKMNGRTLFNRAVLLSGVAVDDWIIEENQSTKLEQLLDQALRQGFCSKAQILDGVCLQSIPADKLVSMSGYGWKLVVDNELIGSGGPISAIKKNHIISGVDAVMLGETATEGTLCLYRHLLSDENDYAQMIAEDRLTSKSLNDIIEADSLAYFRYNITESNPMRMALEAIVDTNDMGYEAANDNDWNLRDKYLDACSSYMVKAHALRFKRNLIAKNLQIEKSFSRKPVEVFHYELKYKPTFSLAPDYIKTAAHGDDVPLIFGLVYTQPKHSINEADLLMTRKMSSYIGNFVHGNHPLLQQHSPIDNGQQATESQNDTTAQLEASNGQQGDAYSTASVGRTILIRRNWSSDERVHQIDLTEREHQDLAASHQNLNKPQSSSDGSESSDRTTPPMGSLQSAKSESQPLKLTQERENGRTNLRMIVMDNPRMLELKAVSEANAFEHPQAITRAQKLLELHKQQLVDNYLVINPRRHQLVAVPQISADIVQSSISLSQSGRNLGFEQQAAQSQQQQQQQHLTAAEAYNQAGVLVGVSSGASGDPYLMSALLIGACVVIFALTSFCIVLSLIVFRYNVVTRHGKIDAKKHLNGSSSTCNICDDSQRNTSIDAVLSGSNHASCNRVETKKDNHGFCNVFAKLRQHANSSMEAQRQSTETCQPEHRSAQAISHPHSHRTEVPTEGLIGAHRADH